MLRGLRFFGAVLLFAAVAFDGASPAHAHQPGLSYLKLQVEGSQITGRLDLSLRDLELAVGLDVDGNGAVTYDELLSRQPAIGSYVSKRLSATTDGTPAAVEVTGHDVAADADGVYAVVLLEITGTRNPVTLSLENRLFFDVDAAHRCLVEVQGGESHVGVFRPGNSWLEFELQVPPPWTTQFATFGREGVWHIWIGFDHILFLIALLLPAVMNREASHWRAVDRFTPALLNVIKIVTAFTLAHSITLSLAVLQLVQLPSRWVESTIALSVVLAALNNLYPLFRGRAWLVAFGFGLVHGFGFASVLETLGLSAKNLAVALVSFNLGVEAGQLAIVALFLPIAFAVRGSWVYQRLTLQAGSAVIVLVGAAWMVERVFDLGMLPF